MHKEEPHHHTIINTVKRCLGALDDKKAVDLKVLDVRGKSSVTDYFIIGTCTSEPHLKALRSHIERELKDAKVSLVGTEYTPESGWLVLDAFDFMIHLFLPETREHYSLETLWRDAAEVETQQLLSA